MNVVELRQYTLHPGQRDVLIDLFDREFVESQEALGMAILGQFRDLADPDRFVWLRGFADLDHRDRALRAFYSGPAWKAHAATANATMIDSDDVLLLRPTTPFPAASARPPVGATAPSSPVQVIIWYGGMPFDDGFMTKFTRAAFTEAASPLACLGTEYARNTYPELPVRTGEHVFVWLTRSAQDADLEPPPGVTKVERLSLEPTGRSLLR